MNAMAKCVIFINLIGGQMNVMAKINRNTKYQRGGEGNVIAKRTERLNWNLFFKMKKLIRNRLGAILKSRV